MKDLDSAVRRVVENGLCSGCGACCLLDAGLKMELDAEGFVRPVRVSPSPDPSTEPLRRFNKSCPGLVLAREREPEQRSHLVLGRYLEAWTGWATDPQIRVTGSSGGVLTALSTWLVSQGVDVAGVSGSPEDRRRTVPITITSKEEALAAAGSRYAPVAVAASSGEAGAVVGKPCEVAALRQLARASKSQTPLYLSFFCAGTPSQHATDDLVRELGVSDHEQVSELWYRGRGWPGSFTVATGAGMRRMSYDESWGQHLGPTVQWRCKLCPDGVGEFSDIVAADHWTADDSGYPQFSEGDGRSAVIVRTERGREVLRTAAEAGVIALEPLDLDELAKIQPLQVLRRTTMAGRMIGTCLGGRRIPFYHGFGLVRLLFRHPRQNLRAMRGTRRRARSLRRL